MSFGNSHVASVSGKGLVAIEGAGRTKSRQAIWQELVCVIPAETGKNMVVLANLMIEPRVPLSVIQRLNRRGTIIIGEWIRWIQNRGWEAEAYSGASGLSD